GGDERRRTSPPDRADARARPGDGQGMTSGGETRAGASGFFADRQPGRPGLALFLNAGDPPLDTFRELVLMLDEAKVDCLELAIPLPNSASDGPVIRASASRALEDGIDRDAVLDFIARVLRELRGRKNDRLGA